MSDRIYAVPDHLVVIDRKLDVIIGLLQAMSRVLITQEPTHDGRDQGRAGNDLDERSR